MARRTLLRGGIVLTMDLVGDFDRADVLIEDGVMLAVGRDLTADDADVTSNVETVLVDGRVVKAAGQVVDVDVHVVADKLAESADGLLCRSGARSILLSSCRAT